MSYLKLILLFIIFTICSPKLLYIAELFRHGARYPVSNIFDGNETKAFHGRLTSVGLRQQYLLGSYLRADYIDKMSFLNKTLDQNQVEVFTDEGASDRCVYSALAHLQGLYPYGSGYKISSTLDPSFLDPPFVTNTSPNLNDDFGLNLGYMPVPIRQSTPFFPACPNQNQILSKRGEAIAQTLAQFQIENAAFTQKMRLVFNLKPQQSNIAGLAELFDVVTCDMNLGREIPTQFTKEDYTQLKYIQNYLFMLIYEGQPGRVFTTPFMSHVIGNMKHIVDGTDKGVTNLKKMSIYSGHDTDVTPLLGFLNLTTHQCIKKQWKNQTVTENCAQVPPFASNLIFQLHRNDNHISIEDDVDAPTDYSVKIRYNGYYFNLCERKSLLCPWTQFESRVKAQLVDYNKACGVKTQTDIIISDE